jgi:integrase
VRGDGHIFKRGNVYWYKYYVRGEEQRETLRTDNPNVARRRAKTIRDGLIEGTLLPASQRRVTVGELLDDLEAKMRRNNRASLPVALRHMASVRKRFGSMSAAQLDTKAVTDFQDECLQQPLKPATINRRCELLRGAFNLGFKHTPRKISRVPNIPMLPVSNARQGFTGAGDFFKILKAIHDPDLADFLEWGWWSAMRPNEQRQLTWAMFDAETWTIHLDPDAEKTGNPRLLPLRTSKGQLSPLGQIIKRRLARRRDDCPLIFYRIVDKYRQHGGTGVRPVMEYRRAWKKACGRVGINAGRNVPGGLTPYDLRRSALRNIVRAGADVSTAMKISGHRTRATFDRYNIVDGRDVQDALDAATKYVGKARRVVPSAVPMPYAKPADSAPDKPRNWRKKRPKAPKGILG